MILFTTRRMAAIAAFASFLSLGNLSAQAETPSMIPRSVIFGNPEYVSPLISPDGRWIAYLRADTNRIMQLWVRDVLGKQQKQVTHEASRGISYWMSAHAWAYNGKLLFLKDHEGNELEHLFVCDLSTGQVRDLTPFPGVKAMLISLEPKKPDHVLIALNRRDNSVFDLWSVNLVSGVLAPVMENPGDVSEWLANDSLEVRAVVAKKNDGSGELRLFKQQGEWTTLCSWKATDSVEAIGISKDEKEIYLKSNVGSDTKRLCALKISTGQVKTIYFDPKSDLAEVLVDPKTRAVQAVVSFWLKPQWQVLDRGISQDFAALKGQRNGHVVILSRDERDQLWTVYFQSDTSGPDFYLWDRRQQKVTLLFSCFPELQSHTLQPVKAFELKARDGLMLPSYLTLPLGVEPKNLPLIVQVHGGPRSRDGCFGGETTHWLANRGYAVLQVNYRGSAGFGKKFLHAGDREFAGKMHDDLIDGVNWAIREGIADPKRIAIMGGSYGGYATLVGLTFTPDVFAAGVSICGFSNIRSFVESVPPYWRPYLPSGWYQMVGRPDVPEDQLDMERRSPLFRVDQIKAPLLLGQGANDPRVKKKESDQMAAALRSRGKEVRYIVFPDEGHGFARPQNRMRFNAAVEEFLSKHLGGRFEPSLPEDRIDEFLQ